MLRGALPRCSLLTVFRKTWWSFKNFPLLQENMTEVKMTAAGKAAALIEESKQPVEDESAKPLPDKYLIPAGTVRGLSYATKKLITKEDPHYLHKTLGLLSLISFIYRYAYVYPTTGTLGFEGNLLDWLTMLTHLLLSTSSLIFQVLPKRILKKPAIIWEEYRLHAIVFTVRCFAVFVFGYFRPLLNSPWEQPALFAMVIAHHIVADMISTKWGVPNQTTVRGKAHGREQELKPQILWLTRVYAFYQFFALASHLTPHPRMMDLAYNALIAIQSSAFLMTLYRKFIIHWWHHAIGYATCLVISGFHVVRIFNDIYFCIAVISIGLLRLFGRYDKYMLWSIYVFCWSAFVLKTVPLESNR